jgi:hypothetical protein
MDGFSVCGLFVLGWADLSSTLYVCMHVWHARRYVELQRIDRPTTTFDLVVHLVPGLTLTGATGGKREGTGQVLELGQIERAELPKLQSYLTAAGIKVRVCWVGAGAMPYVCILHVSNMAAL